MKTAKGLQTVQDREFRREFLRRVVAKQIATDILTIEAGPGARVKCDRIALKLGRYQDGERDMGGYGPTALEEQINATLKAEGL